MRIDFPATSPQEYAGVLVERRIELLESDLTADPMNISVHPELPFAIFRYDPEDEWEMRDQIKLLRARLAQKGKEVRSISMGELLWTGGGAIRRDRGRGRSWSERWAFARPNGS